MQDKIISEINNLLNKEKICRKQIYENLLVKGVVKPNSEKLVLEVIEYGIDNGLINPNKIFKYRKKRGKLPQIFAIEELIKIIDNCKRPKLAIAIWLGFFCGLRIREVCNLRINDIDLQNKKIFVRNSKNTNRSKQGYGKDRIVTLPEIAISPLIKWVNIIGTGEWFLPSMQSPDKPLRTKTVHEQFRALLNRCDLSQKEYVVEYRAKNHGKKKDMSKSTYVYRFHTLRHTYATYLLDKGVPLENIQRCLGHEQLDTTLIYAKVSDKKTKHLVNEAFNMPMRLMNHQSVLSEQQKDKKSEKVENISAEEILKKRLVKGEIDIVTYRRLLAELNPENTINVVHTAETH